MQQTLFVTLEPAKAADIPQFGRRLQQAFAIAVSEHYSDWNGGPIPSDEDLRSSFDDPDTVVYHVLQNGERAGGVVLRLDPEGRRNSLELFFIDPDHHSRGLGLAAWKAVEAAYPETEVWETITPYFEKRNIHFYVNKCGFHVVEFFCDHHRDPAAPVPAGQDGRPIPGTEAFFRFEKVMK